MVQHDTPVIEERKVRGAYRTGEETRQKLLDTALLLFGRQGYEATSTREICAHVGVKVPAIIYHFGSKSGLYLACADHVAERYRARMAEPLGATAAALPDLSPEAARAGLRRVMEVLIQMIRDTPEGESEPWLVFMLREMRRAGPAHDRLYRDLWSPGLSLVAALVAAARGLPQAGEAEKLDALLLLSSLSAFTIARRVALEFTGWESVDARAGDEIGARLDAFVGQL